MSNSFSVDLISDLNLTDSSDFDWTGKSTSLFCVVAGNVSDDLEVLRDVLQHLGNNYRGVFYIDGSLEHRELFEYDNRIQSIRSICEGLDNIVYLHNHVVILNGVAFVGCNGWHFNRPVLNNIEDEDYLDKYRNDDIAYLVSTIKQMQDHDEVRTIVIVSNSIPSEYMYFNGPDADFSSIFQPALCLIYDIKDLVTTWMFGTTDISVDITCNERHYVNNPRMDQLPYWPKKIVI
jgi:hypothetical protein